MNHLHVYVGVVFLIVILFTVVLVIRSKVKYPKINPVSEMKYAWNGKHGSECDCVISSTGTFSSEPDCKANACLSDSGINGTFCLLYPNGQYTGSTCVNNACKGKSFDSQNNSANHNTCANYKTNQCQTCDGSWQMHNETCQVPQPFPNMTSINCCDGEYNNPPKRVLDTPSCKKSVCRSNNFACPSNTPTTFGECNNGSVAMFKCGSNNGSCESICVGPSDVKAKLAGGYSFDSTVCLKCSRGLCFKNTGTGNICSLAIQSGEACPIDYTALLTYPDTEEKCDLPRGGWCFNPSDSPINGLDNSPSDYGTCELKSGIHVCPSSNEAPLLDSSQCAKSCFVDEKGFFDKDGLFIQCAPSWPKCSCVYRSYVKSLGKTVSSDGTVDINGVTYKVCSHCDGTPRSAVDGAAAGLLCGFDGNASASMCDSETKSCKATLTENDLSSCEPFVKDEVKLPVCKPSSGHSLPCTTPNQEGCEFMTYSMQNTVSKAPPEGVSAERLWNAPEHQGDIYVCYDGTDCWWGDADTNPYLEKLPEDVKQKLQKYRKCASDTSKACVPISSLTSATNSKCRWYNSWESSFEDWSAASASGNILTSSPVPSSL